MRGYPVTRRQAARLGLGLGVAGGLAPPAARRALGQGSDGPDLSFFLAQMEGENGAEAQAFLAGEQDTPIWGRLQPDARPKVTWAPDPAATDYVHLADFEAKEDAFRLTAADLLRLAQLNGFPIGPMGSWGGTAADQAYGQPLRGPSGERAKWPGQGATLLFGLRGCSLAQGKPGEFGTSLVLKESRPNHQTFQCVMGQIRADGTLAAFTASTVPNADYMYSQALKPTGRYANLLPTGLHWYRVGTHKATTDHPHRGALIQQRMVTVLRTRKVDANTMQFRATDDWDGPVLPADNIHVAYGDEAYGYPLKFFSAGCQVMPGFFRDGQPSGVFRDFARALAILDGDGRPDPQRDGDGPYAYMLLTGREARLAAAGTPDAQLKRLRFGSSGPAVAALRAKLGVPGSSDVYDAAVQKKVVDWQQQQEPRATAILSPADASSLGVPL